MPTLSLRPRPTARLALVLGLLAAGSIAAAQDPAPAPTRPAAVQNPITRPLSIRITNVPLKDALTYLETVAAVRLSPLWVDENHSTGLDPHLLVSLNLDKTTPLAAIERLLHHSNAGATTDLATWQVAADGSLELGPRSRLNAGKRTVVYDIKDLVHAAPAYTGGPTIDLAAALRAESGGSIFRDDQDFPDTRDPETVRAEDLMELIAEAVEPDQWAAYGGNGATMRLYQGQLVVHAPGYIHRQLAGPAGRR